MMALRKYAQFEGRSRRKEYWYFVLVNMIIQYGLIGLSGVLNLPFLAILSSVYALGVFIPSISAIIRRMHDVGKSGWFCLIPIYNLVLACTDSQAGTNQYGPNPKSNELDVADHLID